MEHFFSTGIEHLEALLSVIIRFSQLCLESMAVFCVLYGLWKTIELALLWQRRPRGDIPLVQLRICFGVWLGLALELQLGSDILGTTVTPTTDSLIRLGLVAIIRTFLNYFLNQELEKQLEMNKNKLE